MTRGRRGTDEDGFAAPERPPDLHAEHEERIISLLQARGMMRAPAESLARRILNQMVAEVEELWSRGPAQPDDHRES